MKHALHRIYAHRWGGRLLFLGLGALAGVPLILPHAWPLTLVALAPVAVMALYAKKREVVIRGWFFGASYMGVAWSWIFSMLPFTWLGIEHDAAGLAGAILVWLILSTALGWVPAMWGYAIAHLRDRHAVALIALATLLLPVLEWLRAVMFSLFAWSPGTGINAHFSLGALGYGLAWSPGLLWCATLGGVAMLSALGACTAILIACTLHKGRRDRIRMFAILMALLVVGFFAPAAAEVRLGERYAEVRGLPIALLHADLAPTLTWAETEARAFTTGIARSFVESAEAEMVVLPEDARFFASRELLDSDLREQIERMISRGVVTIESARTEGDSGVRSEIAVRAGDTLLHTSEKSYLVPFGEYVPLSAGFILGVFGFSGALDRLRDARASYVPGVFDARARVVDIRGVRFGITECSETFSPSIYRAIAGERVDAFINLASHAWIQDDRPLLFNQMQAMAIVHAVAAGVPYLQASSGAPTLIVIPRQ